MKKWLGRIGGQGSGTPAAPAPAPAAAPATAPPTAPPPSTSAPPPQDGTVDPAGSSASGPDLVPRPLDVAALRAVIRDATELAKGTEVADRGGILHPARHGSRIFGEAAGSGATPYRVTIDLPPTGDITARCSCFAARSRPICKHAAALLVAWSRAPGSFVAGEAPPEPAGGRRTASPKRGKVETASLLAAGVEQAVTLVRDLAISGVITGSRDRPEQIRGLAETLRANRLRRLSARVVELADVLDVAARTRATPDPVQYAGILGDVLLTARRIERHLGGETLDDRQVEELIGRTWRKADRRPIEAMELIEYGYLTSRTADEFVIRERRMIDAGGTHYSEKQILPAFLARRTAPLASHAGAVLAGTGAAYPGYAPTRLDMEGMVPDRPVIAADVDRMLEGFLAGPAAAMASFAEHRRDVFAPDRLPVAVRADAIVAVGDRLAVAGPDGAALLLATGDEVLDPLDGAGLLAVLGDLDIDGILAILRPIAVVVDGPAGPAIRQVPQGIQAPGGSPDRPGADGGDWRTVARAAGASPAAMALADVREELASVLVNGLGSLSDRVADSLATRMTDLGLARPAELLRELAARPDPADRLDDVVRLDQVLAIGATRLAGTRTVDRSALVPVPREPAILVPDPGETLSAAEVARRRAAGLMGGREAAIHRARELEAIPEERFGTILPWWADATAADRVAEAMRRDPARASALAERALTAELGLAAALTAVQVLAALPGDRGRAWLERLARQSDGWLRRRTSAYDWSQPIRAIRVAARAALGEPGPATAGDLAPLVEQLTSGTNRDRRADAAIALAALEDRRAILVLRRAWRRDPADPVRTAAAKALAALGDLGSVESFVDALGAREHPGMGDAPKAAAYALGALGEARGADALAAALAAGWKSAVVLEAIGDAGAVMLEPILRRVMDDPSLARRQGVRSALESLPRELVGSALLTLVEAVDAEVPAGPDAPEPAARLHALLRLAAIDPSLERGLAARLASRQPGTTRAEKALASAVDEVRNPKPKPPRNR